MRNISFSLTTEQVRNHTKTVTRRLGWNNVKPGELLQACVKCQGIKKGQHPEKICVIRVKSVNRERLDSININGNLSSYNRCPLCECRDEGFPGMFPGEFIRMFCDHNGCNPDDLVTRIEFEYV